MDWGMMLSIAMLGAMVMFTFILGLNLGVKLERFRRDKEVDAYVIPEESLEDGAYWKMRYEDAVNDEFHPGRN